MNILKKKANRSINGRTDYVFEFMGDGYIDYTNYKMTWILLAELILLNNGTIDKKFIIRKNCRQTGFK